MNTLATKLRQLWQLNPDKTILHLLYNNQPDQAYTYAELLVGSAGYAQALSAKGIQPGEVVVLILQHGAPLVFAFWGAILHGAIPAIMPFLTEKLSPEAYRQSITALFSITRPAAVITYTQFIPEVEKALQNANGGINPSHIIDAAQIHPADAQGSEDFPGYHRQPKDIVLLQHSSGTTGLQKGVALSHQAVFNQITSYASAIHLNEQDKIVSWLPLYHDMGLIAGFVLPIMTGIPLILMSPFDWVKAPYRLLQAVSEYKATLTWLPNFAYNFCAQKIRERHLEHVDLSSWRAVINCSEPMYYHSHQIFLNRFAPYGLRPQALVTCYAMAENVFAVTQGGITSDVTVDQIDAKIFTQEKRAVPRKEVNQTLRLLSAGKPIQNTKVRILSDQRTDLPERHIGEIAIQSDCMLTEYFRRPDLTKEAFFDGWYLTGDLGYLANGELYVTGRKKDLIIVGGKNIYPQDLEYLASQIEGVHPGRVAAFGIPNLETGTEDVVLVAEADEEIASNEAARQKLAEAIRAKVTRDSDVALRYVRIVERGWLIKTSSGKVARAANRDKYLNTIKD